MSCLKSSILEEPVTTLHIKPRDLISNSCLLKGNFNWIVVRISCADGWALDDFIRILQQQQQLGKDFLIVITLTC